MPTKDELERLEAEVLYAERHADSGDVGFHAGRIPPGAKFKSLAFLSHEAADAEEWRDFQGVPYLHIVRNNSTKRKFINTGEEYAEAWRQSGAFKVKDNNILTANKKFLKHVAGDRYTSVVVTKKALAGFYKKYSQTFDEFSATFPHYTSFTVILDPSLAEIIDTFPEGVVWKE